MKISDVIVIGGGLAGLMAAAVAAGRKQSVTVLTYGSGSLPLASGAIDFGNLDNLPKYHPYKKIGEDNLNAAAKFLIDIAAQANLPYVGVLGKKISGVVVENVVREKIFRAKKFILATGGFYSGGLTMREFDKPIEPIFDLPVFFPQGAENWSNAQLFSDKPQGFSTTGILTNERLNPIDKHEKILFNNLHIVGANLGGCDKIFERSAGGIAIASAYKGAIL